ncbi:MAG: MBL fold metallo-hydrolase [Lachnospiraceae bacterium]|nr:MBL fold metallo-hydrolase [Lachnospiraceae bacterium]
MKLTFIGAAHEVTGSCHFLEFADRHILIDCGMEQGADIYENQEIPVNAASIDYVFVTHAHIDHSGLLPLLYARGFRGKVYATNATTQLCGIMLKDSAHIQESEAEWKNRKARRAGRPEVVPMYSVEDAEGVLQHFVPCPYDREIRVCEGLEACFRDAGHLLGSSFIEIRVTEGKESRKLIFSGDLGNGNRALIRDPELPGAADYLIIESTYGDRLHTVPPDYATEMAKVLAATFSRGGNVVIPAFSVGRTQEMLYYLRKIKQNNMLPAFPGFEVYMDSPLSVEATNIFNENVSECFRAEDLAMIQQGINPIQFPGLVKSVTSEDSKAINFDKKPKVIISASGMCEAGRIRHHLKHNLWREECTIVFVGYQVPGTLGHSLLNGATEVKLFGETVQVRAQILNLPGISGHADREHLTSWVQGMPEKPKQIFVVHGEDAVTDEFAAHLTEATGAPAIAPYSGDSYDLLQNACVVLGSRKRAEKKTAAKKKGVSSVFDRLLAAGQRLLAVIHKNKEGSNKDLAKFADQINALCDKWER